MYLVKFDINHFKPINPSAAVDITIHFPLIMNFEYRLMTSKAKKRAREKCTKSRRCASEEFLCSLRIETFQTSVTDSIEILSVEHSIAISQRERTSYRVIVIFGIFSIIVSYSKVRRAKS